MGKYILQSTFLMKKNQLTASSLLSGNLDTLMKHFKYSLTLKPTRVNKIFNIY